jgi:ankyrin repeat protein
MDDPNATMMVIKDYLQKGGDPRRAIPRIQRGDAAEQRELIDLILAKGVPAREIDPDLAVWNFENVRYLVDRGASVRESLILARVLDSTQGLDEVRYLLEKGVDMRLKYRWGNSIMHLVAVSHSGTRDMAALFLAAGADINALNDKGETPLDIAPDTVRKKDLRDYLVSKGAVSGKL